MHKIDVLAILSTIVGVSSLAADQTFSGELSTLFGASSVKLLALLGVLGVVAAQVLRIIGTPTQGTPPVTVITPAASMTTEVKNDAA